MGRTNIVLDDSLIGKAMEITGARSKREAVNLALRRLVGDLEVRQSLRQMRGRYACESDTDAWRRSRL